MKEEYVNSFVMGCLTTFQDVGKVSLQRSSTSLQTTATMNRDFTALFGLTGNLKGNICISMDVPLMMKIASNMMGGVPTLDMFDLVKSAVAELGNMMMGRACVQFSKMGIAVDITPPVVTTGRDARIDNLQLPLIKLEFQCDDMPLELSVGIHESQ